MTERKTIRQMRQDRGWTQQTLAWRVGVDQGAVSAWELGYRAPRPRYLMRLAELFGVSVEDIAFRSAEQAPQEPHPHGMG